MTHIINVDSIKVDTDEGRFILVIDDGESVAVYDIHDHALEFEASVRKELRPYALEAEHARKAVATGVTLDEYIGREPKTVYKSGQEWPFDPDLVRDIGRGK